VTQRSVDRYLSVVVECNMAEEIKNVFVSHIHEDDALVPEMKDLVGRNGYQIRDGSITSDKPNEATDHEYLKYKVLAPRIQWASVLIVLISPDTHTHWWVDWEVEYAVSQNKRVIGVWDHGSKDCDLPASLDKFADAIVGWRGEQIIGAITGKINNSYTAEGRERVREIARYSCS
jgi:MTH538 TIR-like domain (DUF1863)